MKKVHLHLLTLLLFTFATSVLSQETYQGEFFRLRVAPGNPALYMLKSVDQKICYTGWQCPECAALPCTTEVVKKAYFPTDENNQVGAKLYNALEPIKSYGGENVLKVTVDAEANITRLEVATYNPLLPITGIMYINQDTTGGYFQVTKLSKLALDASEGATCLVYPKGNSSSLKPYYRLPDCSDNSTASYEALSAYLLKDLAATGPSQDPVFLDFGDLISIAPFAINAWLTE